MRAPVAPLRNATKFREVDSRNDWLSAQAVAPRPGAEMVCYRSADSPPMPKWSMRAPVAPHRNATKFRGLDRRNDWLSAQAVAARPGAERVCYRSADSPPMPKWSMSAPVAPFAARPSFADWIRETTRVAGAGAELRDQASGRGPLAEPDAGAPRRAQIPKRSGGDVYGTSIATPPGQGNGTRHELPPQCSFHTNRPRVFSRGPATVDLQILGTHQIGLHGRSVRRKPDGRPAMEEFVTFDLVICD
jgi:hypothetical protein